MTRARLAAVRIVLALLIPVLACLPLAAGAALAASLVYEELMLPAVFGPGQEPTPLETLVVRPAGPGRHPLAVINHGSPRDKDDRPKRTAVSRAREAEEFARRGFVAAVVMRRGFGSSGGVFSEGIGPANNPDYVAAGRAGARDIREAIRLLREKPYVDPSRVISVGQSAGGFDSVALAADAPPGLVAVISFAGGKGSPAPDTVNRADRLIEAFGVFGRTARVPMLFVYSVNDHYFSPELAKAFHAAFTASGGKARLILAPPFGEDGHALFSRRGIPLWTPYVDAFLAGNGLTLRDAPMAPERPKAAAPRNLSAKGREAFATYLDAPPYKAFAVALSGRFGYATGKRTLQEAEDAAMEFCEKGGEDCDIYLSGGLGQ
jgi:dienelactone hydrolase